MHDKNLIPSNIWKYYLATALTHFAFFTPIIQLFYLDHSLSILKIAFLGVIWNITRMILEIPSGILADKWGRKKVLIISSVFAIMQLIVLTFTSDYWFFLIASVFSAISYAFLSGTSTAFFYDTLKELKKEKEYEKLLARQHIYTQIPLVISFILSGFLFKISILLPFQLSLLFLFASLIITLTFKEPKYHKPIKKTNFYEHFKESLNFIFTNKYLRPLLFFTLMFCIGSDISYGYGQIYLSQLGLPIVLFGIAYTFKSLIVTIAANIAPKLRKRISYKNIFGTQLILITILFYIMIFTNNAIIGALCFVLIAFPHGLYVISQSSYLHKHTKSHQRATIESMFSFLVALVILILEPPLGYFADIYTMKFPFFLIALLLTGYTVYYIIFQRNKIEN